MSILLQVPARNANDTSNTVPKLRSILRPKLKLTGVDANPKSIFPMVRKPRGKLQQLAETATLLGILSADRRVYHTSDPLRLHANAEDSFIQLSQSFAVVVADATSHSPASTCNSLRGIYVQDATWVSLR